MGGDLNLYIGSISLIFQGFLPSTTGWRIIPWTCTWLMINNHGDRFRPLRIGLWDPFQMGYIIGLEIRVILTTYQPLRGSSQLTAGKW